MAQRRTERRAALAAFAGGVVAFVVSYVVEDTRYVALSSLDQPVLWFTLGWLGVGAAVVLVVLPWLRRPRRTRRVVAAAFVLATTLAVAAYSLFVVWLFAGWVDGEVVERTTSADGRYELRLVEGHEFIDPFWEVRLRERRGLLTREEVVWYSSGFPGVASFRFTGPRSVEVVDTAGTVHTTTFEPGSLEVEPLRPVATARP